MNATKHPRFIKSLETLILFNPDCPVTEAIAETFTYAGFDTSDGTMLTRDGDTVRLIAIDCGHQFPIVGEVIDFGANTSWLARWSASGIYAASCPEAIAKHSLVPNVEPGTVVLDPRGCCDPSYVVILHPDSPEEVKPISMPAAVANALDVVGTIRDAVIRGCGTLRMDTMAPPDTIRFRRYDPVPPENYKDFSPYKDAAPPIEASFPHDPRCPPPGYTVEREGAGPRRFPDLKLNPNIDWLKKDPPPAPPVPDHNSVTNTSCALVVVSARIIEHWSQRPSPRTPAQVEAMNTIVTETRDELQRLYDCGKITRAAKVYGIAAACALAGKLRVIAGSLDILTVEDLERMVNRALVSPAPATASVN